MGPSMTLSDWYETGQFTSINGQQIFFNQCGEDEVILFIHGFPTSSWDWYKLWNKLSSNNYCVALDMLVLVSVINQFKVIRFSNKQTLSLSYYLNFQ